MFSMPQPVALDILVNGCPVLFLSDNAEEIDLVLALFCDNFKCATFLSVYDLLNVIILLLYTKFMT